MTTPKKETFLALVFVITVVLLFFLSRWLGEGAYFRKDLAFITIPLENLYGLIQRSGESTLWAPELAGGYPLLATGQLGFWYPLHFLLRSFLPGVWTLNLSLLIHALIGSIGMLYWLKHNRFHSLAASMGAILFALGTNMVGKYESLNLVLPYMWLPLLFLLLQRFAETKKPLYFFLWLGVGTQPIIAGHPQMALSIFILEAFFVLCLLIFFKNRFLVATTSLLGVLLVVGLTAFYWVPVLDVIEDTDRAQGTLKPNEQEMFDDQFTPAAFLGLLIPHPFGHHEKYHGPTSENGLSSYYGPVVLLVALIGLIASRKTNSFLWWVSLVFIVVGLLLATGGYSPVFRWMVRHGWTYFNSPSRFFFYTHVGLVLLVTAGTQVCLVYLKSNFLRGLLIVSMLGPALWVSWTWHDGVPWRFTKEPALVTVLRQESGTLARVLSGTSIDDPSPDNNFDIRAWNLICEKCRYRQSFVSPFAELDGLAIKLANVSDTSGEIILRLYSNEGELLREVQQPTQVIVDSEWTPFPFEQLEEVSNKELYFEVTSTIVESPQAPRLLIHRNPQQQYDPTGRLYNCTTGACTAVQEADAAFRVIVNSQAVTYYDALAYYVGAGFGIESTQWLGAIPLQAVKEYLSPFDTWGDTFRGGYRTMMNRFATTHIIGVFPPHRYIHTLQGFSLVTSLPYGDSFLRLYRNEQAFPRVHFAQRVKAISGSTDQINNLLKTDSQERETVIADVKDNRLFEVARNQATLVKHERTVVDIQTEQATEGFLVLRDVFLKGWVATIDGQPTEIHRVDGVFRGIFVPPGSHMVTFVYKPLWIKKVVFIEGVSVTALIILIGYFSFWRRSYNRF